MFKHYAALLSYIFGPAQAMAPEQAILWSPSGPQHEPTAPARKRSGRSMTVAQQKRVSAKRRAVRRARKLGHA
ncbi:hypothetical protein C4N9_20800 [Pararhodobacter marinus]|uniref:Uncharacterized protein n=1 Tax=Pararhodobacter marinus TaxID=2184063 RepID=A0A2U2C4B4_9RHOB|nr:hypothetical protein [Pararhodobacter marinus]PWE26702.1 hypothetical protein C4N9_20800 [Pararhodobacter marinus]